MSAITPRAPIRRTLRALRPLGWLVLAFAVVGFLIAVFVTIDTNVLWFRSIGHSSVYSRTLWTEIVMFLIFGGIMFAAVTASVVVANRAPAVPSAAESRSRLRKRWTNLPRRVRRLVLIAVPVVAGVKGGFAAAARWQLWLLWRNAVPAHAKDGYFHRDLSYFLEVYPFHRFVVSFLLAVIAVCVTTMVVIGWLRGAINLRGGAPRVAPNLTAAFSITLGLLAIVRAGAYWLDRMATSFSADSHLVTGPSYTDIHALLPLKFVLLIISLLLAVVFFANAFVRGAKLPLLGLATMVIAGVLLGWVYPTLVQTFVEKPAALKDESPTIARNIAATDFGFGLSTSRNTASESSKDVAADIQPRLMDPNVINSTFTQLQQDASYYQFKNTLDIDRYDVDGKMTDEVLGVRELKLAGLATSQQSWTNTHLVYTHGIGVFAANSSTANPDGLPIFDTNIGRHVQDRIYFGQYSPAYSIVGAPKGQGIEFDSLKDQQSHYSYQGNGGVSIGSTWRQLLYALRFHDKNIFFSSEINPDSQILYTRNPRARIQQVAPWLTLDGDVYPVVADHRITWVADAYTTSSTMPDSQEVGFKGATATTLTTQGASVPQSAGNINYIRNSVVATVDAYTGAVTLYQKPDAPADPLLQTWEKAFPGLVEPASDIPAALLPHLRYPTDLFNLQRQLLTRYHIQTPDGLYSGTDYYRVPIDPTVTANIAQPSYYATTDTTGSPAFTLSSPLLSYNRRNIAAYLTVNCDVGSPDYGMLELQQLPQRDPPPAPQQIQNTIETDPTISSVLTPERIGVSRVRIGNLQTIPVDGTILAIEPIYQLSAQGGSYPVLRHVAVVYGHHAPGFASTFPTALAEALGTSPDGANHALLAQAHSLIQKLQKDEQAGNQAAVTRDTAKLDTVITQLSG